MDPCVIDIKKITTEFKWSTEAMPIDVNIWDLAYGVT